MNIDTNNIPDDFWKRFAGDLLWHLYLSEKDGPSNYSVIIGTEGEDCPSRGQLVHYPQFLSYTIPVCRDLTWSQLGIVLGLDTDRYVTDGHDCTKCPKCEDCNAGFKYEIGQAQCDYWKRQDRSTFEYNLQHAREELLKPFPKSITVDIDPQEFRQSLEKEIINNPENPDLETLRRAWFSLLQEGDYVSIEGHECDYPICRKYVRPGDKYTIGISVWVDTAGANEDGFVEIDFDKCKPCRKEK